MNHYDPLTENFISTGPMYPIEYIQADRHLEKIVVFAGILSLFM